MPKFCKYCGDPIIEGELFCDNCGKRIAGDAPPPKPTCARCGAELNPAAKFCRSCGAPTSGTSSPRPAAGRTPPPLPSSKTPPPRPAAGRTPPPFPSAASRAPGGQHRPPPLRAQGVRAGQATASAAAKAATAAKTGMGFGKTLFLGLATVAGAGGIYAVSQNMEGSALEGVTSLVQEAKNRMGGLEGVTALVQEARTRMGGMAEGLKEISAETPRQAASPISGGTIQAINKPFYLLKEEDVFTSTKWAIAIEPRCTTHIPKNMKLREETANVQVKISGDRIDFKLPELIGFMPVGFLGPEVDAHPEMMTCHRDAITLHGTITDRGTTKERDEPRTCYYLHGSIDSVDNDLLGGHSFNHMRKQYLYYDEDTFSLLHCTHDSLYTNIEKGQDYIRDDRGEITGVCDAEFHFFSRFELLYFPDDDFYQVEILLLENVTANHEMGHGGRRESKHIDQDSHYTIALVSDLKMFRESEITRKYILDDYVTIK